MAQFSNKHGEFYTLGAGPSTGWSEASKESAGHQPTRGADEIGRRRHAYDESV